MIFLLGVFLMLPVAVALMAAWVRGWKGRALIPAVAFCIASGQSPEAFFWLELICFIVLVAMAFKPATVLWRAKMTDRELEAYAAKPKPRLRLEIPDRQPLAHEPGYIDAEWREIPPS